MKTVKMRITKEAIRKESKKMSLEELEGHYNYTRVSGHIHKNKTKYDRKKYRDTIKREWDSV